MPLSDDDRSRYTTELDAAMFEMNRCLGGVDPAGLVAVSKRIMELRNLLRDNATLLAHFQVVMNTPARVKPRRSRSL